MGRTGWPLLRLGLLLGLATASSALMVPACTTAASASKPAPHLKIIVVAGQSNAEGYESYAVQPGGVNLLGTTAADAAVPLTYWGDYMANVSAPPAHLDTPQVIAASHKQVFGPEVGLARYLWSVHHRAIAVVKVTKAGSSLAAWEPGQALLTTLAAQVTDLEQWERARGVVATVAGIVWMQGETEALEANAPTSYRADLAAFMPRLRRAVGATPGVPVVVIRTSTAAYVSLQHWVRDGNCIPTSCANLRKWNAMVRDAQLSVAKAGRHIFLVDSGPLPRVTIQLHLSASSELDLGTMVGKVLAPRI